MIIENKTDSIIGVHSKSVVTTLMPGGNQMDEETYKTVQTELEFLKSNNKVVIWASKTEFDNKGKAKVVKPAKNLTDLDADEAEKLIANTVDLKTLEAWKEGEARDSVRLALTKQIDKINNYQGS